MAVRVRGMREWRSDLHLLDDRIRREAPRIVKKGAQNIKTEWRAAWEAIKHPRSHIPHLVRGIGYDTQDEDVRWAAQIGVSELNSQAPLAHLIEYGSPKSAPHPAGQHALDAEAPRFEKAVADMAEAALDEH